MGFVKLDTGILDSTLWVTRDPREVFITALLMAMPRELDQETTTYKVHSLDVDDFKIPPGWYGFIEASGPGIVRRAGLPADAGLEALAALGQPDRESRSSDWEGRRLVRVDGGFVVLNFMKYRDKDNTANERMKRYRERQKSLRVTDATPSKRNVTASQLPAEDRGQRTEAEIKTVTVVEAVGAEKPKARGSRLPADWALPDAWREWAKTNRPDLDPDRTADRFRDYWAAKAGASATKVDWQATWRNWVREERPDPTARRTAAPSAPEPDWRREQRERMAKAAPYAVPRVAPQPIDPQPEENPQHELPLPRTAPR